MGKNKAPEYAKTTYGTGGLFGSSTSSKKGTSFTGENWQNVMGNTGSSLINTSLANMLSNDYSNDPNFQAYQNQLNKTMAQNYDTSVLSNLANRGLMRSSGLQAATNSFANTLADNTMDLYDNYYNRQVNNLSNALNSQNQLYNWITGLNNAAMGNSKNVSDYNMEGYKAEQAANQAMWNSLMQSTAALAAAPMTGGTSIAGTVAANALKK